MVALAALAACFPSSVGPVSVAVGAAPAMPIAFPYLYQQPKVASSAGVQGTAGPNVASSQIGPVLPMGSDGAQGHLGPINLTTPWLFVPVAASLSIHVLNGTAKSHANSIDAAISVENLTSGLVVMATSSAAGTATLSITEGWFLVVVTPAGSSFDTFRQQLHATTASPSLTIYCLPVASYSVQVSNGPASADTAKLVATVEPAWQAAGLAAINVTLLNESSAGAPLKTATTTSNGSVLFGAVDTAFQYALFANGYNLSATNVAYGDANYTTGTFTLAAGANGLTILLCPLNTWTATITGTSLTAAGAAGAGSPAGDWLITGNTAVTGGSVVLGSDATSSSTTPWVLTFRNTVVYFDNPRGDGVDPLHFAFINSTVIMLAQTFEFNAAGVASWLNDSAYLGGAVGAASLAGTEQLVALNSLGSVIAYLPALNTAGAPSTGNYTDTEFLNFTEGTSGEPGLSTASLFDATLSGAHFDAVGGSGWLNATNVVMLNSTWAFNGNVGRLQDSYLNFTANAYDFGAGFSSIPGSPRASLLHDLFSTSVGAGLNYTTVYNAVAGSPNGNLRIQYPAVSNWTDSIVQDVAYPDVNTTFFCSSLTACATSFYDCLVNFNQTIPHLQLLANTLPKVDPIPRILFQAVGHLWMNYSTLNFATVSYAYTQNGNATFSHDWFPYAVNTIGYYFNQAFVGSPTAQHDVLIFSNDSTGQIYDNATLNDKLAIYDGAFPSSVNYVNDLNDPTRETARYLAVNYTTFRAAPEGAFLGTGTGGFILDGENLVNAVISHDLFLNDPSRDVGPSAGHVAPYGPDVNSAGGTALVADCWFENLTNETVPILSASDIANTQGWGGHLTLLRDHFYYAPRPGSSFVPAFGEIMPAQVAAHSHLDPTTTIANSSTVTYELPSGYNTTTIFAGGSQYVSNTSIVQATPANLTWRPARSWSIAPDVNASGGVPAVSFANGGEGGPQPNFYWDGGNYSEAVESAYVRVAADSSSDLPIYVGAPGGVGLATYYFLEWNSSSGKLIGNSTATANSLGEAFVAFNPRAGVLNATFEAFLLAYPNPSGSSGFSLGSFDTVPVADWLILSVVVVAAAIVAYELEERRKPKR